MEPATKKSWQGGEEKMKAEELITLLEELLSNHLCLKHAGAGTSYPFQGCETCSKTLEAIIKIKDSIPYYMAPGDMG